jgi:hypothetical protein
MKYYFIIGAQKSGTTALWEYLRAHPENSMPVYKESAYFLSDRLVREGWDQHVLKDFDRKPDAKVLGTASPYYMCYPKCAKKISNVFNNAKIIAILRDPIDRAFSHYTMMCRIGAEHRSFEDAIKQQLSSAPTNILEVESVDNLSEESDIHNYLAYGKYHSILNEYRKFFRSEDILTISFSYFYNNPKDVYQEIVDFLEINPSFYPKNLGKKYNVGGDSFLLTIFRYLRRWKYLIQFIKILLPDTLLQSIRLRFATVNGLGRDGSIPLSNEMMLKLESYYNDDFKEIKNCSVS